MKIVAVVQARMASSRLPGKVLLPIEKKPMLWHVINRLKHSQYLDDIIIATSKGYKDDPIVLFSQNNSISYYRGKEDDVLDRYYQAVKDKNADYIVRITGDCPLIDPIIVDNTISHILNGNYDYVNILKTLNDGTRKTTYPDGLDVEVFTFESLEKAWNNANEKSEREHVTSYIWNNPDLFNLSYIENEKDDSTLRLTVDYPEDLIFVRKIYNYLWEEEKMFYLEDIIRLLETCDELLDINSNIVQHRDESYYNMRDKEKRGLKV